MLIQIANQNWATCMNEPALPGREVTPDETLFSDREIELSTGLRIDAALRRIQANVCMNGMAGRWHLGKASRILEDQGLVEQCVGHLDELDRARFLARLPTLIEKTREQDTRCQAAWERSQATGDIAPFTAERRTLLRLFRNFQFTRKEYERVVRQSEKPMLHEAIGLLERNEGSSAMAVQLETMLRLRLRDFVARETQIADALVQLDGAREELVAAHRTLGVQIANEWGHADDNALASAMVGLSRASRWFDHKRGFSFAVYAQHWIREAIEKRRGVGDD